MPDSAPKKSFFLAALPEDWQAVIIAFIFILLAAIGVLGQNGIKIGF